MPSHTTRASLLVQLRDKGNELAWSEFVSLYMPLLHSYAMKAGLQDSDAADVAQDTVRQVVRNIERFDYQPHRGSFRGWLLTIARNIIRKQFQQRARVALGTGDSAVVEWLQQQPEPAEWAADDLSRWEGEYRERVFHMAAKNVASEFRPHTWQAFWQTAVEGRDALTVASELQMSLGAVYIARSRVLARLREEVARFDDNRDPWGDGL